MMHNDQDMDFLHLGVVLPLTINLVFMFIIGVCRCSNPTWSWPSWWSRSTRPSWWIFSTTLTDVLLVLKEGTNPNFLHLKKPDDDDEELEDLFFSSSLSIWTCMELHWLWSLSRSSFNLLISICWADTSRLERHRVGGSNPGFGLRFPLNDPLQSLMLFLELSLVCSVNRTWITARTGNLSFCAAWSDASGDSFRQSISLQRLFRSCFDALGCACIYKSYTYTWVFFFLSKHIDIISYKHIYEFSFFKEHI